MDSVMGRGRATIGALAVAAATIAAAGCQNASTVDHHRASDTGPARPPAPAPAAPAAAPLDARAAATDAPRPAEEHAMELTWTLRRDGDHLAIDYTVHNGGDAQVWVADELLQNTPAGKTMRAVDRLIVRDAAEPDLVSLVRGMTYDSLTTGRERPAPSPAMKAVPAGGEVTGTATVPLPLEAWHNYGKVAPLQGDKRRAVLQLTYVTEPDQARAWRQIPTEDGRKVDGLDPYYLKDHALLVSGAPLPLP